MNFFLNNFANNKVKNAAGNWGELAKIIILLSFLKLFINRCNIRIDDDKKQKLKIFMYLKIIFFIGKYS